MNDGDEPDPLMELFRTEVREQLATLRGDAEPPDKIRAAHTIRGAARIVGATALAEIAADLEARLGTHPGEDFTALYESIEALADRGGEFPDSPATSRDAPVSDDREAPAFDIDAGLLELFREEVRNHCAVVSQGLLDLERDSANPQRIEPLMRAAHSRHGRI